MATKKKQKIVSKEDLRRLMKEKTFSIKTKSKRIDHPLAKYNSLDQLTCSLCNVVVKSDALWVPHIQSRQHKEKIESAKTIGPTVQKRKLPPEVDISSKKHKGQSLLHDLLQNFNQSSTSELNDICKQYLMSHAINRDMIYCLLTNKDYTDLGNGSDGLPANFFDNKDKKPILNLAEYSSDEEEEEDETTTHQQISHPSLPSDFFDSGIKPASEVVPQERVMADVIPEGFFDNPKQDAKVRQVEYKDKMEEEWEMFQRAMKEESHVSEAIVEEEDEQINVDRNIEEIDDQINRWKEVNDLHIKKEEMPHKTDKKTSDSDNDSDIDDENLEDFLDWRSKKIQIKN